MLKPILITFVCVGLSIWGFLSCSENTMAKKYGGTMTVNLPPGTKLECATWKDEQLWYLYRNRKPGEAPESHTLHEDSRFGIIEGKVIFEEK